MELLGIDLRRSEGLQDLRAGIVLRATVEYAVRRKATGQVRIVRPPDRYFVAAHVQIHEGIRLTPTDVHDHHPPIDLRPSAIEDLAAAFVLVEAPEDEAMKECGRLRPANGRCLG